MTTGFDSTDVLLIWRPRLPFLLPNGMEFWWRGRLYRHRPGGYTDGMSSPQFTHALPDCDPLGWNLREAVAHDGGYHNALDIWDATKIEIQGPAGLDEVQRGWKPFELPKESCDAMFLELMQANAETAQHQLEAEMFYLAVSKGGQAAFDQGRGRNWDCPSSS